MNSMKGKYVVTAMCLLFMVSLFAGKNAMIRVVTEELGPYNYTENGHLTGFSTDVVREVLKRAGLDHKEEVHPWSQSYDIAQNDSNVLIFSIARNIERESLFKWVGVIAEFNVYFGKLKSRRDIRITSLADAKRYRVGVVKDDYRAQFLAKNSFSKKLIFAKDDGENIRHLFERKIDVFPADRLVAYHMAHKEGYAFKDLEESMFLSDLSIDLYIAFSKRTSDVIIEKCVTALSGMKRDGTYDKIKEKYDIFYLPELKYGN